MTEESISVFVSYAHEDYRLRKKLDDHLSLLKQQGRISVWHDRDISAGTEWEREIDEHLNTAQIILLLISPKFMGSKYCYSIEMKHAMQRHERGEASVIPVILSPVDWQEAPFGKFQALPTGAKPITGRSWHTRDEAFLDVVEGIRREIVKISSRQKKVKSTESKLEVKFNVVDPKYEEVEQQLKSTPVQPRIDSDSGGKALLEQKNESGEEKILISKPNIIPNHLPGINLSPTVPSPSGNSNPSRKTRILLTIIAFIVIIAGVVGLLSLTIYSNHQISVKATATASVNATATAATQAYDSFVAANGMMFGFDAAHTHFNPYERILTPTNVSGLKQAWTSPKVGIIDTSPAVVNGVVYVGSDDWTFHALDASTGSQLWSFQTGGSIFSSPAVANGVVYVGSNDHRLYALDASTGKKLWSFHAGDFIESSPAVANGVVYVGSFDGRVYAFDLK